MLRRRAAQAKHRLRLSSACKDEGWVFTKEDGGHLNPNAITKAFTAIRTELGLPQLRLHDLRHTHATMLLEAGVHLKVVQERLGHATVGITADTYSHVTPGLQKEAARKFEERMRRVGKRVAVDA